MAGIRDYKKYLTENYNKSELSADEVNEIFAYWKTKKVSFSLRRITYNNRGFGMLLAVSNNKNSKGSYTEVQIEGFVDKDRTNEKLTAYYTNLSRCAKLYHRFNPMESKSKASNESILSSLKVGDKIIGTGWLFRDLDELRADDEGLLDAILNGFIVCEISEMTEPNVPNYLNYGRTKRFKHIWLKSEKGSLLTSLSAEYCLYQFIAEIIKK